MIADDLDNILKIYLQQDVQFVLNDKIVREGRIILFNIKDFYVTFTIHTKKNQNKTYELPVPFKLHQRDKALIFDYNLVHIHHNDAKQKLYMMQIYNKTTKKSKLYDNILTIRPNRG